MKQCTRGTETVRSRGPAGGTFHTVYFPPLLGSRALLAAMARPGGTRHVGRLRLRLKAVGLGLGLGLGLGFGVLGVGVVGFGVGFLARFSKVP